ncbi:MAG: SMP-30/gluconolactonase/LRE family protein [Acidobacteriaceae bacterium]
MKFGIHTTDITPHIASIAPLAALPGGEVEVHGRKLATETYRQPTATIGEQPSPVRMSRGSKVLLRVPDGAISGNVQLRVEGHTSNAMPLSVGVAIAEEMDPVANPAVDLESNIYVAFSGQRGQQTPVSVFQIDAEYQVRPFATGILNATGLALDAEGNLYVSSRHEGTVYRVTPSGAKSVFAEGMGVATGLAFDRDGFLYVGDRSGTVFKISPTRQVFVFATLEPSVSAYHLAFNDGGTLLVSGPTTSANESIHAIEPNGEISCFYTGLGRPQGMAFDADDNLYVAASLHGRRGVVKITPKREASLVISGSGIVGLAFLPEGDAAVATRDTVYHVGLDIVGRLLH